MGAVSTAAHHQRFSMDIHASYALPLKYGMAQTALTDVMEDRFIVLYLPVVLAPLIHNGTDLVACLVTEEKFGIHIPKFVNANKDKIGMVKTASFVMQEKYLTLYQCNVFALEDIF